jgi:hypothetical protein
METLNGMLANAIHEDRARASAHPMRHHAAELRDERRAGSSRLTALFASIGRVRGTSGVTAGAACTTPDGRVGRLVARDDGGRGSLVCELG